MGNDGLMAVLLGAALFFIGGTLLPLFSHDHWTIRFFDFPRVQLALGSGATMGGLVLVGPSTFVEYAVVVVLGLCLVYQIERILLYTPLASRQVRPADSEADGMPISVLVCNVEIENRDVDSVLNCIAAYSPDLVFVLETDEWWVEQLQPLEEEFPYTVTQPQDDAYGTALYSRWPLVESRVEFLVEDHVPSIHTKVDCFSRPDIHLHHA